MIARRLWAGLTLSGVLAGVASAALIAASANPVRAADAPTPTTPPAWDRQAAARYLDGREAAWQAWDRTHKDRATFCISCHTQATYGMARPVLRQDLGEAGQGRAEQVMLASIDKRVNQWAAMQPFYSDIPSGPGKEVESHNTESVLNAVILSSYDVPTGHLSATARLAFDNAWALQSKTGPDAGAWVWQNFHYGPWEAPESQYHWAALMAVAIAKAPDHYRDDPKAGPGIALLTDYLHSHFEAQPMINQIVALWASQYYPGLLSANQRARTVGELTRLQHPDGGWSTSELAPWTRVDKTPEETRSDGYATALIVLVLEEIGAPRRPEFPLTPGLVWLQAHQDKSTGAWTAWSVNKTRDPASMEGHFMTDAATSFAVLALEAAK